jgi:hypothetical protein
MSRPVDSDERAPAEFPTSSKRRRVRRAAAIALVVALMCGAYVAGSRIAQWQAPVAPLDVSTPVANAAFMPLSGAMLQSGGWTFAGQGWDISTLIVDAVDVDSRLSSLSDESAAQAANFPDVPQAILHAIESSHVQPIEHAGNQLYKIVKPNLKAQLLVCKVESTLKAVSFGIAYPSSSQKWQFLEGRPNGKSAGGNENSAHLLPLTDNGNRIASRFAGDGQLLLEVITLSSNADELTIKWREAGWEVRPSGLGNSAAFSLLCGRGNDVVYAWSPNPPEALQTLILVRSPTDAEMQAANSAPTN